MKKIYFYTHYAQQEKSAKLANPMLASIWEKNTLPPKNKDSLFKDEKVSLRVYSQEKKLKKHYKLDASGKQFRPCSLPVAMWILQQ